jgi:HEAT repeat protein
MPTLQNADFVAFLTDTSTPLPERRKAIEDTARRGDVGAFEALTAAAEAGIYLNWAAVRAIGDLENAGLKGTAAEFLRGKVCDPDMRVACEAIRGCGRLLGEEAVPVVAASIEKNRNRPDGHGDIVAETAVEVLGEIASPKAVPVLTAELQRPEVLEGDLEYGSELVRALARTGTPEARNAIAAYAEGLAGRIPDDRLAGTYYETKIAEARACLDRKEKEEVAHD